MSKRSAIKKEEVSRQVGCGVLRGVMLIDQGGWLVRPSLSCFLLLSPGPQCVDRSLTGPSLHLPPAVCTVYHPNHQ